MSQVRFIDVAEHRAGQRLDNFLLRELKSVPRTRIYRALRTGEIRVNKGRAKADYRVRPGDRVRVPPLRMAERGPPTEVPPRWAGLLEDRLIYEDRGLWVLDKPSGLAVHGGSGLNIGLIECLRLLRPREPCLELVHRLDRDTSGCIMVARKASVLKDLQRQLREDRIAKGYLALVDGRWSANRTSVEAPLKKNTLKSGERIARVDGKGKLSRTEFRVVERFADCTLVEARPITGRTHQIRVHARYAGHPLLGDDKYTPRGINRRAGERGLKRLFLHAVSLEFDDISGASRKVEAPLDAHLKEFLDKLSR